MVSAQRLNARRSGSGEPLVLIHGLGASARVWSPVLPALARHHEVIAVDLPGFGESAGLPLGETPSVPALAEAVERELDALGIEAAHVAGSSLGGWIALELAARGRARTVVALAPAGGWTRAEALWVRAAVTAYRAGAKLLRPAADRVMRPARLRRALLWLTNARGERMDACDAAAALRALADGPAFEAARDWSLTHRPAGLDRIECPVVIAWGMRDRLLSPRQGPRLKRMVPGAALVDLPGLGHLPVADDPDLVARVMLEATGALPPANDSAVRAHEVVAQGLRTRVLESGPDAAEEAVVFLHGAPGSANAWDYLLPRAGELGRAVAFDLPGFGEADKPADWDYSPASYATFIAGALGELGIRRAHVVMTDVGGWAGVFWAAAHPDAFASAVLINCGVFLDFRWHPVARLHRTPLVGHLVARGGRLGLRRAMRVFNGPRGLPEDVLDRWSRDYDWPARRAVLRFHRAADPAGLERLGPALRRLDRPALALYGPYDGFVPLEQAEQQRRSFPSVEIRVLDDSGHYPHLDNPEAVAAAVVPFLERQLG